MTLEVDSYKLAPFKRATCVIEQVPPEAFDVRVGNTYEISKAAKAINVCFRCPVIQECYDFVEPDQDNPEQHGFYSGVVAARAWLNGHDVTGRLIEDISDAIDAREGEPE